MSEDHRADIDAILARRHDNGADHWATEDGRIYVGSPFSTLGSLCVLHELGVDASHEAVAGGLELVFAAWRDDGRIRLAPRAPLYPCYTAEAARTLARFGLADDPRVRATVAYLVGAAHDGGGWRCSFTKFGKGPETECANPGATLFVLDLLRLTGFEEDHTSTVDRAVKSLLSHWETRIPCGPCHHGIGTKFLRLEYPFTRYNLFYWVYVLSHFEAARQDTRFHEAAELLESKLDNEGRVVVEAPHRRLAKLAFCRRGEPSGPATSRYREIVANLAS